MRLDHLLSKEHAQKVHNPVSAREEVVKKYCSILKVSTNLRTSAIWGCSSAGRAPALHAGGQEFDPPHLHHGGKDWKDEMPKSNEMGA